MKAVARFFMTFILGLFGLFTLAGLASFIVPAYILTILMATYEKLED